LRTAFVDLPVYEYRRWRLCHCQFDPKSKAPQEKISCAYQHFLSHRGLWQHPSDFNCPDHRWKDGKESAHLMGYGNDSVQNGPFGVASSNGILK
jgi:hypothetical protein